MLGPAGRGSSSSGRGSGTRKGLCSGTRASALPLSAALRDSDPAGLSWEEEQAAAGSTGGGLRGLWAARRGPEAPLGGGRAPLRGRAEPRGAAERRERARGKSGGTPEEIRAGGSLVEIEGFPREGGVPLKRMEGLFWVPWVWVRGEPWDGRLAATSEKPVRMDGRRKRDPEG